MFAAIAREHYAFSSSAARRRVAIPARLSYSAALTTASAPRAAEWDKGRSRHVPANRSGTVDCVGPSSFAKYIGRWRIAHGLSGYLARSWHGSPELWPLLAMAREGMGRCTANDTGIGFLDRRSMFTSSSIRPLGARSLTASNRGEGYVRGAAHWPEGVRKRRRAFHLVQESPREDNKGVEECPERSLAGSATSSRK